MPTARFEVTTTRAAHRTDTLVVLGVGAALFCFSLSGYPLWDPDESRHALVAREMLERNQWLVPVLHGKPYYHKPAPFYWLVMLSYHFMGVGELAARLPSAIASLATLLLLHRHGLRWFGRAAAAWASLIYLTTPEVVALGRFCNLDATLAFFITAAVANWLTWLWSGRRDSRARDFAWLSMALGTLAKGPVAIAIPGLALFAAALRRNELVPALRQASPVRGLAIGAAIVLPWLLGAALADPRYVETFLLHHNLGRFASVRADHPAGPFYFFPVVLAGFFPWSLLLPVGVLGARRITSRDPTRQSNEADTALWALAVFAFYSVSRGKLGSYVLPMFPALAIWLGSILARVVEAEPTSTEQSLRKPVQVALWMWIFFFLGLCATSVWGTRSDRLETSLQIENLDSALLAFAAIGLVGAATGYAFSRPQVARIERVPLLFASGNLALLVAFYGLAVVPISRGFSDRDLTLAARRISPGTRLVRYRIDASSPAFYGSSGANRFDFHAKLRKASTRFPLWILTRPEWVKDLQDAGLTVHPRLAGPRHHLYATFPNPGGLPEPHHPERSYP